MWLRGGVIQKIMGNQTKVGLSDGVSLNSAKREIAG